MIKEVTDYINNSDSKQINILNELRELIFSTVPEVKEHFKWSKPVYTLQNDFCYLNTTKNYVTLGFFEYSKIETNPDLLEGTGKNMRHIKITSSSQILDYKLNKMLEEVLK